MKKRSDAWLVYDGDCPFCSRYVQYLRLREVGLGRLGWRTRVKVGRWSTSCSAPASTWTRGWCSSWAAAITMV